MGRAKMRAEMFYLMRGGGAAWGKAGQGYEGWRGWD